MLKRRAPRVAPTPGLFLASGPRARSRHRGPTMVRAGWTPHFAAKALPLRESGPVRSGDVPFLGLLRDQGRGTKWNAMVNRSSSGNPDPRP
jgi:hypothetical protein